MNAKRLMGQRLPTLLATSILGTGLLIGCSDKASTEAAASEPAAEVQTDTAAVATPTDAAPESAETTDTAMSDSMDMDNQTDDCVCQRYLAKLWPFCCACLCTCADELMYDWRGADFFANV